MITSTIKRHSVSHRRGVPVSCIPCNVRHQVGVGGSDTSCHQRAAHVPVAFCRKPRPTQWIGTRSDTIISTLPDAHVSNTLYHLCPTRYTTCHDISVCLSFGNSVLIESGSKELHCIDLARAYELSIGYISVYDSLLESSSRTATYPKF